MSLDETKPEDVVKKVQDFPFAYDQSLDDLFEEILVDYKSNWFGKGFTIGVQKSSGSGSCCS